MSRKKGEGFPTRVKRKLPTKVISRNESGVPLKASWSDEEKANALVTLQANDGDIRGTSLQLSIPYTTLWQWSRGQNLSENVLQMSTGKKQELAQKLEAIAYQLADTIPSKIDEASLVQISTSLGITIDKMRLLREQSTNNTASIIQRKTTWIDELPLHLREQMLEALRAKGRTIDELPQSILDEPIQTNLPQLPPSEEDSQNPA